MAVVLALLWLIAGVAPALHQHAEDHRAESHYGAEEAVDAHCHDSGPTASPHLETQEPAHHEACGLCAKVLSFAGLERSLSTTAGGPAVERAAEGCRILPPGPPGRHGASRAPPLA